MKKIYILILLLMLIPAFAGADLEYTYPNIPGTDITIVAKDDLGNVVKYIVTWLIIIGAIIVFVSLIFGGTQYLSSTGNPAAMKSAQDRIIKSILGLIILLCSYLILVTINPQLTIMQVQQAKIVGQGAMVTKSVQDTSQQNVQDLTKRGKDARSLKKKIQDGIKSFGKLFKKGERADASGDTIHIVEFSDFTPDKIVFFEQDQYSYTQDSLVDSFINVFAFWRPAPAQANVSSFPKIKVVAYPGKNFESDPGVPDWAWPVQEFYPNSFEVADEVLLNGDIIKRGRVLEISPVISIARKGTVIMDQDTGETNDSDIMIQHPPLSYQVLGTGPGAYVYGERLGSEIYMVFHEDDFRSSHLMFNDKGTQIEIKNDAGDDYMVILFEDPLQEGKFRMFLERKNRQKIMVFGSGYETAANLGNTMPNQKLDFTKDPNKVDMFGKIKKPSSAYVAQLSDDLSVCEEVRLCTGPSHAGNCIVYTHPDATTQKLKEITWNEEKLNVGLVTERIPFYEPIPVPKKLEVKYQYMEEGDDQKIKMGTREGKFEDNIVSIKIKGKCLVALFEHKPGDDPTDPKFWNKNDPGDGSELFSKDENNLTDNNVFTCHPYGGIRFWQNKSCVSSLSVFPLK